MIIPYISGDLREVSASVLAYIGDSVYELYARCWVAEHSSAKSGQMHKMAIKYVSAKSQSMFLTRLSDEDFFSDDELDVIRRARNNTSKAHPKNTDIITYKRSTGLECLIGSLRINNNDNRIKEIMEFIVGD